MIFVSQTMNIRFSIVTTTKLYIIIFIIVLTINDVPGDWFVMLVL